MSCPCEWIWDWHNVKSLLIVSRQCLSRVYFISVLFCFSGCKKNSYSLLKIWKVMKSRKTKTKINFIIQKSVDILHISFLYFSLNISTFHLKYWDYNVPIVLLFCSFNLVLYSMFFSSISLKITFLHTVFIACLDCDLVYSVAVGRGEELWCILVTPGPKAKEPSGVEFPVVWLCTSR